MKVKTLENQPYRYIRYDEKEMLQSKIKHESKDIFIKIYLQIISGAMILLYILNFVRKGAIPSGFFYIMFIFIAYELFLDIVVTLTHLSDRKITSYTKLYEGKVIESKRMGVFICTTIQLKSGDTFRVDVRKISPIDQTAYVIEFSKGNHLLIIVD